MAKRQWDEDSFFEELRNQCGEAVHRVARQLLEWCIQQGYMINYGAGPKEGTLAPSVRHPVQQRDCKLFEMFNCKPGYVLLASYLWANKEWPNSPFGEDEKRKELTAQLNKLPLKAPLAKNAFDKRPRVSLDSLSDPETLQTFMEVHEWIAKEIAG